MDSPTFDADGYPTDETLRAISEWPVPDDTQGLIEFVMAAWKYPDAIRYKNRWFTFETGGWSGNESIVAALNKNLMFRVLYWYESRRGGHYEYRVTR